MRCGCGNEVGLVIYAANDDKAGYWKPSPKLVRDIRKRQASLEIEMFKELREKYPRTKTVEDEKEEIDHLLTFIKDELEEIERKEQQ